MARSIRFGLIATLIWSSHAYAELQNVQANGATFNSVDDTAPHVGVIQGVVLDTAKNPVQDATITLQEEATLVSDTGPLPAGQHRHREYTVPRGRNFVRLTIQTDALGRFTFSELPLSTFSLDGSSETGRYHGNVTLSTEASQKDLPIAFEPATTIRGRVVDSSGKPAASAQVSASIEGAGPELHWSGYAKTAEDGTFTIPGAPIARYTLLASFEHNVGEYKRGVTMSDAPLELVAMRPGRIRGTVVDEATGFPMYGVQVGIQNSLYNINQNSTSVETDDNGHFEVSEIYPGDSIITAHFPYRIPRIWIMADEQQSVRVQEDATADITIKMKRGGTVVGRVVDADSGEIIPNARVSANVTNNGRLQPDSNSDGTYRLVGFRAGQVQIQYDSAMGYPEGDKLTSTTVQVDYGQTVTAPDIRISRGLIASGRTLDASGKGVLGVEVSCEIIGRPSHQYQHAVSMADGVFQIYGLRQGDSIRCHGLRHYGGDGDDELVSEVVGPLEVGADGLKDVTLKTYAPGTISGVLVDPSSNRPLGNVRVRAQYLDTPQLPFGGSDVGTNKDGTFTIRHLATGRYSIEVSSRAAETPVIQLARGEQVKGLTIKDPRPQPPK